MKPIIRFRQYNKEWRPFKLNTILVPSNEKNTKGLYSKNDVLSVSGEAGIVNQIAFQGRSFAGASVLNYGVVNTNDIVYTKSPLRNNPYGIIKTNNGPSGIVSTLYAIYNCCEESCPQFVDTYFTSSSRTNNYLRPLVRKGAKNDMKVSSEGALQGNVIFPYKDEQIEIASYFRTLDAKLQASAKKVESLKKLKSASLVAMFPQNGESMPKVRFKGFEGEWDKQSASDLFLTIDERNRPELPVLSACQDVRGMIPRDKIGFNVSHDTSNEVTYKRVQPGQFVIHLRSFQGGFAHSSYDGIISPAYTVFDFKNKEQHDDYYWKIVFMSRSFIERLRLITYGIRDGRSISFNEFKELSFLFPSKEEQQAIASFFRSLDRKIALETARLEKLKQIKLACLDKMFV